MTIRAGTATQDTLSHDDRQYGAAGAVSEVDGRNQRGIDLIRWPASRFHDYPDPGQVTHAVPAPAK